MLTDTELQGIGAQSLNMAKRDMEKGGFNFLLAAYNLCEVPPLHRMDKIEALVIEGLGEDWLNHGRTKDLGFHVLRMSVDMLPPDAVAIVTMCNGFSPTRKFHAMTPEQQRALMSTTHDHHHEAVRKGLLEVCDVLLSVVQTPERVLFCQQKVNRGGFIGAPETKCIPQEGFDGRLKMYGKAYETPWEHQA